MRAKYCPAVSDSRWPTELNDSMRSMTDSSGTFSEGRFDQRIVCVIHTPPK